LSPGEAWAQAVTTSARAPWNLAVLALTVAVSWWLAGWRAALLAVISFAGVWLLGPLLNTLIARPRPSPLLVRVVGSTAGYSFPSIFALTYGATIGYLAVLAWQRRQMFLVLVCVLVLVVGGVSRVALGGHWPSDVLISYLIALVWAALLARFS
jgi:undecaprenyl-diphosphatase